MKHNCLCVASSFSGPNEGWVVFFRVDEPISGLPHSLPTTYSDGNTSLNIHFDQIVKNRHHNMQHQQVT